MSFNRDQLAKDIAPICDTHTEHCLRCKTLLGIIERVYWAAKREGMGEFSDRMAEIIRDRSAKGAGYVNQTRI